MDAREEFVKHCLKDTSARINDLNDDDATALLIKAWDRMPRSRQEYYTERPCVSIAYLGNKFRTQFAQVDQCGFLPKVGKFFCPGRKLSWLLDGKYACFSEQATVGRLTVFPTYFAIVENEEAHFTIYSNEPSQVDRFLEWLNWTALLK